MEIAAQTESIYKNTAFAPSSHVQERVSGSSINIEFSPHKHRTLQLLSISLIPAGETEIEILYFQLNLNFSVKL